MEKWGTQTDIRAEEFSYTWGLKFAAKCGFLLQKHITDLEQEKIAFPLISSLYLLQEHFSWG